MYYPCSDNIGLISFAVTVKLICVFVYAYADCWFSYDVVHLYTFTVDPYGVYVESCTVADTSGFDAKTFQFITDG